MTRIVKPGSIPAGDRVSIFLRGKTWYCNFQQNGQQIRRSLGTTSKKEAILRAQRLETELSQGDSPNQIRVATLSEVSDAFLSHTAAEDRAPKTLTKYKQVAREVAAELMLARLSESQEAPHLSTIGPELMIRESSVRSTR